MKKLNLIFSFLFCSQLICAQCFEKILTGPNYYYTQDIAITNNDDIVIFANSVDFWSANQTIESKLVLLDKSGNIKRERILSPQNDFGIGLDTNFNSLFITSSLFEQDTFLVSARVRIDTSLVYANLLFRLDTSFNILNYRIQDTLIDANATFNRMKRSGNVIKAIGSNFQIYGAYHEGIMTTIDDSLQSNTKVLFNTPDSLYLMGTLDFLIDSNKNTYIFSEGNNKLANISNVQFIKMDSNNNVLKRAFINYPVLSQDYTRLASGVALNAFWKTENSFVLSATGRTEMNRKGDIHLFEYNTSFALLNYHRIVTPDTSEYNLSSAKTGAYDYVSECFYIGATKRFRSWNAGPYTAGDTSDFQLVKFDKDLRVKFVRYYRRYNSLIFTTLKTDSEGNVIMVGTTQPVNYTDPLDADIFVLKVDSLGNLMNVVGINGASSEIDPLNFQFYPNPAKGMVNFRQYNIVESYEMELFNNKGQLMEQYSLHHSDNSIDLSGFANGIYFYHLIDSKGRSVSGKLIKN